MKAIISAFSVMIILGLAGTASAENVGQAVVDGRVVILNSDGTWHFRDDAQQNSDCDSVSRFMVCLRGSQWSRLPKTADFSVMYSRESRYYFGIISEPIGAKQGVREDTLQRVILENAARGGNTTVENVTVHDVLDRVDNELGLRGVVYSVEIDSLPLVYYNAFKVYENQSVQFVFWMIGNIPEPAFLDVVSQTLRKIGREE